MNRVPARIVSTVYAGQALTYVADGAGQAFKVFAQNRDARPHAVGDDVQLVWSPAHTVLIEEA
jgi:spermidine/putrescine transport system ATP-binding protein